MADHFKSVFRADNLAEVRRVELFNLVISMQIDEDELLASLRKLDDNIRSGPDLIPPYFLKRCTPTLNAPILYLFNKSLSTGIFPLA